MRDMETLRWHESGGARILLPAQLIVKQPFPELYADLRQGQPSIIAVITSSSVMREACEQTIQGPHVGVGRVVLEGKVISPFSGIERVIEVFHSHTPTPDCSLYWERLLYLDSAGVIVDIQVWDRSPFREVATFWQMVMDSFSWDPRNAVVLRFDGDEAAHRARYRGKSKPRKPLVASATPNLPARVRYLQPVIGALISSPPEEVNEDWDTSVLEESLRNRVGGLSLEKAEMRLEADHKALKDWIAKDSENRVACEFLLAFMYSFQFALGDLDE